jgi:N-acylneuraminate cytidylyltransferase
MRILAVVPARGGSKRLPGKNLKLLNGKPLINWTIESTREISDICETMVSTDSIEIAEVARIAGGFVPWLRPTELASDEAKSVDVAIHALDWYEENNGMVDGILLLQPTSPFRTSNSIRRGIELFVSSNKQPVIAVTPSKQHPSWAFKLSEQHIEPLLVSNAFGIRKQDLVNSYHPNGSLYLVSTQTLRETKSFGESKAVPLIIESETESLDIDSAWDFKVAEFFALNVNGKLNLKSEEPQ